MLRSETIIETNRVGVVDGFDGSRIGIVCFVNGISSIITTRRGSQFLIIGI